MVKRNNSWEFFGANTNYSMELIGISKNYNEFRIILLGFVFLTFSSIHFAVAQSNNANDAMLNKLTPAEIKKGWKLLFDGSTLTGWKTYNRTDMATSWGVKDGAIFLDAKKGRSDIAKGDLVTLEDYDDFEFFHKYWRKHLLLHPLINNPANILHISDILKISI